MPEVKVLMVEPTAEERVAKLNFRDEKEALAELKATLPRNTAPSESVCM